MQLEPGVRNMLMYVARAKDWEGGWTWELKTGCVNRMSGLVNGLRGEGSSHRPRFICMCIQ